MNHTASPAGTGRDLDGLSTQDLRKLLEQQVRENEEYRTRVRDRAIRGFVDNQWDLTALNDTLERLELPQFEPRYVTYAPLIVETPMVLDGDLDTATSHMRNTVGRDGLREAISEAISKAITQVLAEYQITEIAVADDDSRVVRMGTAYQKMA